MPLIGSAPPCGGQVPPWGLGPCPFAWWQRAMLPTSLEQVLPVSHLLVTGMLVWCVGTCPHAAHRQSFVDGLITWIARLPRTLVCWVHVPLAVASLMQPSNVASCTSSNWVLLAVRLAWHLSLPCPITAMQHPCAVYSRMLAMKKSCKMATAGPTAPTPRAAYHVPPAVWLVWVA